jgi:hypothetical protein
MSAQRHDLFVAGLGVAVVYQNPYPHTAVRGMQQRLGHQSPCLVTAENIVLKIEGSFGGAYHLYARQKAVDTDWDEAISRVSAMLPGKVGKLPAEARLLWMGQCNRTGFGVARTGRQRCAAYEGA